MAHMRAKVLVLTLACWVCACHSQSASPSQVDGARIDVQEEVPSSLDAFESVGIEHTRAHGELLKAESAGAGDGRVALIIRYVERTSEGGPGCSLAIVGMTGGKPVVVESSDRVLSCSNAIGADLVKHGLEADVSTDRIVLEEEHVRSHSTFEFEKQNDGRWHLAHFAHVGPEDDLESGELLAVSHTATYAAPVTGPTLSEFSHDAIRKDLIRSVIE